MLNDEKYNHSILSVKLSLLSLYTTFKLNMNVLKLRVEIFPNSFGQISHSFINLIPDIPKKQNNKSGN